METRGRVKLLRDYERGASRGAREGSCPYPAPTHKPVHTTGPEPPLMSEVLGITVIVAASYTAIVAAADLSILYRLRTKQYNPPDGGKATDVEQVTDEEKATDAEKATATRGLPVSGRFAALLPCAERRRKLADQ